MRYTPEHKQASRERIIEAAAALFCEHGYAGVGVDRIMSAAGLTRGGFYGHFASKAALYQAVLRHHHGLVQKMARREGPDADSLQREAQAIVGDYLEPQHRQTVMRGCSLAALSVDTTRADAEAQSAYADAVRALIKEFSRSLSPGAELDKRAVSAVIASVGGLLLSAACAADQTLSDRIAEVAREMTTKATD